MDHGSSLIESITGLGNPNILLIGDFMLDEYVYGDAVRISPEAPVPVLKVVRREYLCGGAASVAADLAALGATAICVGILGRDVPGKRLESILRQIGADTAGLVRSDSRPTTSKQRLVGLAQHRHQQQLMRIDEESDGDLSDADAAALLEHCRARLDEADLVCIQDYGKGVVAPALCRELIALARGAGKQVLIDPARMSDYRKYSGATVIAPNRHEASGVVGFPIESTDDAHRAAQTLRDQCGLDAAIITLDRDGAYLHSDRVSELIPTRPKNVYDVTGAGDVVLATLATTLAAGCDYRTAVQLSNIAGGIEVEKFGVATVTADEIIAEIITRNRGETGKVIGLAPLLRELKWRRSRGEVVVFTNGCFDLLHKGHTDYLRFCRSQGDVVVVGLNSDDSVRALKGPERPVNRQGDRAAVLASLESVDYVVVFEDPSVLELVKTVNPDVLVKGGDCAERGIVGREYLESRGGKVVLAPLVAGRSSTSIIEKINTPKGGN